MKLENNKITKEQADKEITLVKDTNLLTYEDRVINEMLSGRPSGKFNMETREDFYRKIFRDYVFNRSWEKVKKINEELRAQGLEKADDVASQKEN